MHMGWSKNKIKIQNFARLKEVDLHFLILNYVIEQALMDNGMDKILKIVEGQW